MSMSRTISVMHMHLKNRWSWIYIPLLILVSSFVVNFAVSIIVREERLVDSSYADLHGLFFGPYSPLKFVEFLIAWFSIVIRG